MDFVQETPLACWASELSWGNFALFIYFFATLITKCNFGGRLRMTVRLVHHKTVTACPTAKPEDSAPYTCTCQVGEETLTSLLTIHMCVTPKTELGMDQNFNLQKTT